MAFPSTSVLDDFNRANGAVGSNYTIPTFLSGMNVSSNTCVSAGANGLAVYNVATYTDCEVYATLTTKPSDGNSATLQWRLVQYSSVLTLDGYYIQINSVAGAGNDTIQVNRVTNAAPTAIGAAFTQEIANGDVIGVRMVGDTIEVFVNGTSLGTRTDSTYTGAGTLALGFSTTSGAWDDFGGGAYVAPSRTGRGMLTMGVR